MILNGRNTRLFTANLFADFILSYIDKDECSRIMVTDTGKFFVINGYTTSKEKVNLSVITEEFNELFNNIIYKPITNTIDIIDYESKPNPINKIQIRLYDTENCVYSNDQLDLYKSDKTKNYIHNGVFIEEYDDSTLLSVSSSQPFGYSAKDYRALLNYTKKIYYNLRTDCLVKDLIISLDLSKSEPGVEVYNLYYETKDEKLKSVILDYFDFDLSNVLEVTKNMDFLNESLHPNMDLRIFKKRIDNLYIF